MDAVANEAFYKARSIVDLFNFKLLTEANFKYFILLTIGKQRMSNIDCTFFGEGR